MRHITKEEFIISLKNKNGNFRNIIFDFDLELSKFKKIDFELDFKRSIFSKKVIFDNLTCTKDVNISSCVFLEESSFIKSTFQKDFTANKTEFYKKTSFDLSKFASDVDFNKSVFHKKISFKKTRFYKSLFFNKTFFYKKVDFSYAYFSYNYVTSFLSINRKYGSENKEITPPSFIFRYIYFPEKISFTDIDLSKTIFQDSTIEYITFKDCDFPKIDGRDSFYTEQPKIHKLNITGKISDLSDGIINTIILNNTSELNKLTIGDKFLITSNKESDTFFIVALHKTDSQEDMMKLLENINQKKSSSNFGELICRNCSVNGSHETIAFQIKKFSEKKHWNVLEDAYRQMKKSLEDSHDWQAAGDFYKGEMIAKINTYRINKEHLLYRIHLSLYKLVSCFGESLMRIFFTMLLTFILGSILLHFFKPELSYFNIIEKNAMFFIPIFGNTAKNLHSLSLDHWQNIIILIEIAWFYLLWLILAIAARRRFKR